MTHFKIDEIISIDWKNVKVKKILMDDKKDILRRLPKECIILIILIAMNLKNF